MGDSVPTPRSGHREVRLRHYIVFINTRQLLLLTLLQLVCTATLIAEPYDIILPTAKGIWRLLPPLLCQCQVKDRMSGNVL